MSDQPFEGSQDKLALISNGNISDAQILSETQENNDADQLKNLPPLPVADPTTDPVTIPAAIPSSNVTEEAVIPVEDQSPEPVTLTQEPVLPPKDQSPEPAVVMVEEAKKLETNDFNLITGFRPKSGPLENSQLQLDQDISEPVDNDTAIVNNSALSPEFDADNENIAQDVNQMDEDYTLMDPSHVYYNLN